MGKGKNLNPADAYRKSLRKKELKKNKAERSKVREFALVKKDTHELEGEIEKLEAASDLSAADKSRLTEVKAELAKIMAKKEEYVKEHPERRKLVYRRRRDKDDEQPQPPVGEQKRNLFNKRGLPRHPERSIYYDPVLNPYGVPPPGMPYIERPLREDDVARDEDNAAGSDDDVVMPEGPPPSNNAKGDDDIPMPEGPPSPPAMQNLFPVSAPMPWSNTAAPPPAPLPPLPPPFPPFPLHYPTGSVPSPPPPPPPPGFGGYRNSPYAPGAFPAFPPPPGFFPRQATSADPLLSIPHKTYLHSNEPVSVSFKPPAARRPPSSTAVISAAPELRDLKKEATAFVPSSLKRKKVSALPGMSRVNAAPPVGDAAGSESKDDSLAQARPDLVSTLRVQLGAAPAAPPPSVPKGSSEAPPAKSKDDYQKFLEEMSEILDSKS